MEINRERETTETERRKRREEETRRGKHGQDKFQTLLLPESGNSSRDIDGKTNIMDRNLDGQPQRTENVGISR